MLETCDKEKYHLIEWISIINCLDVEVKNQLEFKTITELEVMYHLALLQVQDESLG